MWHAWGETINAYKILWKDLKVRNQLENLVVDGKIISKWILGICGGKV
jgi:hypothetical protein